MAESDILERLYEVIEARKQARSSGSYVASLLESGPERIADKVREEAEELIEAAGESDLEHAAREAADLLFHTWVLLSSIDLEPARVFRVLEERFGTGGLVEKASRTKGLEG